MFFKKFDKKLEEPISENIGPPYNILPKGYPKDISKNKINSTIDTLLHEIKANAASESTINRYSSLITLGSNELNDRTNKKHTLITFTLTIITILAAFISIYLSTRTDKTNLLQKNNEIQLLNNINENIIKNK